MTVDGKPVDMARVNYVLRAVNLPAGDHEVIFRFDPQSVHTTEAVAYVSLFLILGAFVVVGLGAWKSVTICLWKIRNTVMQKSSGRIIRRR